MIVNCILVLLKPLSGIGKTYQSRLSVVRKSEKLVSCSCVLSALLVILISSVSFHLLGRHLACVLFKQLSLCLRILEAVGSH